MGCSIKGIVSQIFSRDVAHSCRLADETQRLVELDGVVRLQVDVLTGHGINQHSHQVPGHTLPPIRAVRPYVYDVGIADRVRQQAADANTPPIIMRHGHM